MRDCYLADGFLEIRNGDTVVDFDANIGAFSLLSLGPGQNVRVVSVEPTVLAGQSLSSAAAPSPPPSISPPRSSPTKSSARYQLTRIDLLKCDIEGSEFELLHRASPLLNMSRQVAIELHNAYGDPKQFAKMLEDLGFEVNWRHTSPTDCILNARRK